MPSGTPHHTRCLRPYDATWVTHVLWWLQHETFGVSFKGGTSLSKCFGLIHRFSEDTVNLGEDADTTCAVYGQIPGAYYGVNAIPVTWRDRIARGAEIVAMAELLAEGPAVNSSRARDGQWRP